MQARTVPQMCCGASQRAEHIELGFPWYQSVQAEFRGTNGMVDSGTQVFSAGRILYGHCLLLVAV